MYPREFEDLLTAYLTDGVISEKERRVLLNKARSLGIDQDEIDLYIDSRVQKLIKEREGTGAKKTRKTCPYCGCRVAELEDKCPECGNFISPQADQELKDIIEALEEALVELKSGLKLDKNKASVERYLRKANLYYGSHPKVKILTQEVEAELEKAKRDVKKMQIREFIRRNIVILSFILVILVEILLYFIFDGIADNLRVEYDTLPYSNQNRHSYWELHKSYIGKRNFVSILLIVTAGVGISLLRRLKRKNAVAPVRQKPRPRPRPRVS